MSETTRLAAKALLARLKAEDGHCRETNKNDPDECRVDEIIVEMLADPEGWMHRIDKPPFNMENTPECRAQLFAMAQEINKMVAALRQKEC